MPGVSGAEFRFATTEGALDIAPKAFETGATFLRWATSRGDGSGSIFISSSAVWARISACGLIARRLPLSRSFWARRWAASKISPGVVLRIHSRAWQVPQWQ